MPILWDSLTFGTCESFEALSLPVRGLAFLSEARPTCEKARPPCEKARPPFEKARPPCERRGIAERPDLPVKEARSSHKVSPNSKDPEFICTVGIAS